MNELLQKTQAGIMEKADPRYAPAIKKVVEAGKKVMYSEQTRAMFLKQMEGGAQPEAIGAAVAKLMGILQNQSKGTIPPEVLVKAATLLMVEGLQFLEDSGLVEVTPDFLAACTKAMGSAVLQMLGATPEQLSSLLQKGGEQPAQPEQPAPAAGIVQGAA
jgi:hypothetical protein